MTNRQLRKFKFLLEKKGFSEDQISDIVEVATRCEPVKRADSSRGNNNDSRNSNS